jgi:predicted phage-related endonuclease
LDHDTLADGHGLQLSDHAAAAPPRRVMNSRRLSSLKPRIIWQEKRGAVAPQDYSTNLVVQLGVATEPLNRRWFERTTGQVIKNIQSWVRHPVIRWTAATLDGIVEGSGAVLDNT